MTARRLLGGAGSRTVVAATLLLLSALTALGAVLTIATLSDASYTLAPGLAVVTALLAAAGASTVPSERRRLTLVLVPVTLGAVAAWTLLHVASTAFDAQGPGLEAGALLAMLWSLAWCAAAAGALVPPPSRRSESDAT